MGQTQGKKAQRMQALSQSSDYETHFTFLFSFSNEDTLVRTAKKKVISELC